MTPEQLQKITLTEANLICETTSAQIVEQLNAGKFTLTYPPNTELTDAQWEVLNNLRLSDDAKAALKTVIRDACGTAFFLFFSVLDGVANPNKLLEAPWNGALFTERDGDNTYAMLHDEFYEFTQR
jgi:hypothetical protein